MTKEDIKWARKFKTCNHWLNRVLAQGIGSDETEKQYARVIRDYCGLVGKNPDELIAQRKAESKSENEYVKHAAEDMLMQAYLDVKRTGHKGKALLMVRIVKSFYDHNFVTLKVKEPKVAFAERLPISKEDLKLLYEAAKPKLKLWLCVLKDTGLGRGDVLAPTYGQVKDAFERGEQFIPIHVIRHKTQSKHVTFIGRNTVEALKLYLKELEVKGVKPTSEMPLINVNGKPTTYNSLGKTLQRFGKRYGIKVSCHNIRKFFETSMAFGKVHPLIVKFWMGHKISGDVESHYIPLLHNVQDQLKLYQESYRHIDITGTGMEERVKAIEEVMASIPEEQRELMKKYGMTLMRKAKHIEAKEEETETNGGCGRQKVISEAELSEHLQQGWRGFSRLCPAEM